MWKINLDWDDEVPFDLSAKWKQDRNELTQLNSLSIPRLVSDKDEQNYELQLHIFADASEIAFGACIYLRSKKHGHYITRLLIAKSRVAPEKATTLPRLELCAAVLLVRLYDKVKSALEKVHQCLLWTDSTIVLA